MVISDGVARLRERRHKAQRTKPQGSAADNNGQRSNNRSSAAMLSGYKIAGFDPAHQEAVQAAIDFKTKPPGSLGRIEQLALQIAGAQGKLKPAADPARLLLFAGDHGMVAEGVSAWPSAVTTQMVANFLAGGAAANVFARANGIAITIIDAGIAGDLPDSPQLVRANIAKGTRNAMHEDAMSPTELSAALEFGASLAARAVEDGARVIALGEMGIGNTSSAALLAHAVEGLDLTQLCGPGAGLDAPGVARKAEILKRIAARRPGRLAPQDALAAFGGLEIAGMAGALVGAAARGGIVLVDGFIATAGALCALRARPDAMPYVVFAHRSKEPGHRLLLEALGAEPLVDLDLRLGEGTGALLAFPLLRAACAMLGEMATFASAGVSGKEA
jgi:nicotinate-nucleotide--dimethylbenzimidazole phosphoribosyltransferase